MNFKRCIIISSSVVFLGITSLANADTLDTVKERGKLICGVNTGLAGFATPTSDGWKGLDVDVCRAVATAIFNDPSKVDYKPLSAQQRFTAIQSGEVDVLSRNTTVTLQREASVGLLFAQVVYYDGQGFLTTKKSGIKSAKQLDKRTVCVQPGTTTELNLSDFARSNGINIKPVVIEKFDESVNAYISGRCDAYTTDSSGLAAIRATIKNPSAHVILPEIISKEPLAPGVRQGDDKWFNIVNWTVRALLNAEELGVTSTNVGILSALISGQRKSTNLKVAGKVVKSAKDVSQNIKRLLNSEYAGNLGLESNFVSNVILKVGNYGELFDKNIGISSALKLERGLNALWSEGGLQYAPPFR